MEKLTTGESRRRLKDSSMGKEKREMERRK